MKRVAFVFTQGPHGSAAGREGLDAVLATSALSEDIGVFFVGDGVLQLLPGQQPEKILARNYIATFGVLPLYDVDNCYLCATAIQERAAGLPRMTVSNSAENTRPDTRWSMTTPKFTITRAR